MKLCPYNSVENGERMNHLIISPSQQKHNKCVLGDTERDHVNALVDHLMQSFPSEEPWVPALFRIPIIESSSDIQSLKLAIEMSNDYVISNRGIFYHLALHTDAGYDAKGVSGFYISEAGKSFSRELVNELSRIIPWGVSAFKESNYYELLKTKAVATIIEITFHDKMDTATYFHNNMLQIAKHIVAGLKHFFDKKNNN